MANRYYQNEPLMMEKIIASLSYIYAWIGFLWLLLSFFMKRNLKPFLQYHIFQSLFIAISIFLISAFLGILMNILSYIPLVNLIIMHLSYLFNTPIISHYSFIEIGVFSVLIYLAITAFQGKYTYIPWVSDIIKANVR